LTGWLASFEDRANDLLNVLERIAAALERIADRLEHSAERRPLTRFRRRGVTGGGPKP
jgi:hypothetical protein